MQKTTAPPWRTPTLFTIGISLFFGAAYLLQKVGIQPNWKLLLEYIKALIWPLVVIWALIFLKQDIPNLLERLEELNILGNNAKFRKINNQGTDTQADELKGISADAPEITTKTNNDLQVADDKTHKLLNSYDAAVAYTQIYTGIFGTQIKVLQRLLDYNHGLDSAGLTDILREHITLSKNSGFTEITPFMQYLLHHILVIYNSETKTYYLTNAGFYFLVFLDKAQLLNRPKDL